MSRSLARGEEECHDVASFAPSGLAVGARFFHGLTPVATDFRPFGADRVEDNPALTACVHRLETGATVHRLETGATVHRLETGATVHRLETGATVHRLEAGATLSG